MMLRSDRIFPDKAREYMRIYRNFCDDRQSWNSFSLFFGAVLLKFCEESTDSSNPFAINKEHYISSLGTEENAYENLISLFKDFYKNNSIEFQDITNQSFFESNLNEEEKNRKIKILALELSDKNKSLTNENCSFFNTLFRFFQHGSIFFNPEQRAQANAKELMFTMAEKNGCENIVFSGIENGVYFDYQGNFNCKILIRTQSIHSYLIQTILKIFSKSENIIIIRPDEKPAFAGKSTVVHFPKSYVSMRRELFRTERESRNYQRADELYKEYLLAEIDSAFADTETVYLYIDAQTLTDEYLKKEFLSSISKKTLEFAVRLPNLYFLGNYRQSFVFGFSNKKQVKGILLVDASYFTEKRSRNELSPDIIDNITGIINNKIGETGYSRIFTEIDEFQKNLFKSLQPESSGSEDFKERLQNLKNEIALLDENIKNLEHEFDGLTDLMNS